MFDKQPGFKVFEQWGSCWVGIGIVFDTEKEANKRLRLLSRMSPDRNFKVQQLRKKR